MNAYDFDNTIYDGESVFDFYIFCALRHPALFRYIFVILAAWAKYKFMLLSREKLMELAERYAQKFIDEVRGLDDIVQKFWNKHIRKIKPFYLANRREDDVIITASVGFLIGEACKRLGIKRLICSEIDTKTGEIKRLCFRQNKTGFFLSDYPGETITNFYSDSMNDLPMMCLAENAFLVKGDKIKPVPKEKINKLLQNM